MNSTSLRQLIKESIQEYIREIDQKGDEAAVKAKMEACEEAITLREKKIQAAESLEEVKDMVDPSKIKALKSEIKTLEKSLKKYQKQLDKMNSKAEKSEDTEEEKEIVDEVTIDEIGHEADSQLEEAKKKKKKEEKELMNESFLYMQKLAGVITEAQYNQKKSLIEAQLNEDILELKQMSKQLYTFLKSKGFEPELVTKITKPLWAGATYGQGGTVTSNKSSIGKGDQAVQIQINETEELVLLAITPHSVAKILVGGGDDWFDKARKKFGDDSSDWFRNPEITKYVDKLGEELVSQIKNKYPNIIYKFEQQQGFFYVMYFKFGETKKGGTANPNQRPNAPKPSA